LKFENKITVWLFSVFIGCFTFFSTGFATSADIEWLSYDDGISMVEKTQKKLLISFYSELCEYCKVMDKETFKDSAIVSFINKNFIPIRVNSDKDQKTAEIFKVRGLPDTWFMSETKEVIGHRIGFIPAETMIIMLKYINSESYKRMSFKNFADGHQKK
jgi:thioredoxin-related protein